MIILSEPGPYVPLQFFARNRDQRAAVGDWFADKYRQQAADVGYLQAARNLRKQGVPLGIARLILLGE